MAVGRVSPCSRSLNRLSICWRACSRNARASSASSSRCSSSAARLCSLALKRLKSSSRLTNTWGSSVNSSRRRCDTCSILLRNRSRCMSARSSLSRAATVTSFSNCRAGWACSPNRRWSRIAALSSGTCMLPMGPRSGSGRASSPSTCSNNIVTRVITSSSSLPITRGRGLLALARASRVSSCRRRSGVPAAATGWRCRNDSRRVRSFWVTGTASAGATAAEALPRALPSSSRN
ncbi:hypothetical protein D3C75_747650 [compost metagenome]